MDPYTLFGILSALFIGQNWFFLGLMILTGALALDLTRTGRAFTRFFLAGGKAADLSIAFGLTSIVIAIFAFHLLGQSALILLLMDAIFTLCVLATVIRYDTPKEYRELRRRLLDEKARGSAQK